MHPEFRKFVGEYFGFRGPPGVGGLEAMGGVCGAQLTGLHHEGNETGGQGQEEKWIAEPVSEIQYVIMAYW